jgi:hypothetical protein
VFVGRGQARTSPSLRRPAARFAAYLGSKIRTTTTGWVRPGRTPKTRLLGQDQYLSPERFACFGRLGTFVLPPLPRIRAVAARRQRGFSNPVCQTQVCAESFLMLEEEYAMERRVQSHGRNSEMLPFGATSSHAHLTRLDGQIFSGIDLLWIDPKALCSKDITKRHAELSSLLTTKHLSSALPT